jgi:uncharacterized protein (TIGR02246 family)
MSSADAISSDHPIHRLYEQILIAWNQQDAAEMAAQFEEDGNLVGFDGSQADSRADIEDHLRPIFTDHPTAAYVAKVREIRMLSSNVGILRAVVGMIPPGSNDIYAAGNTIQTLVAVQNADDGWQATLFQSTPATWHGRPQDSEALTEELRDVMRRGLTCR